MEKTTQQEALRSQLLTKYFWSNQIKNNEMGGHVARIRERINAYRNFENDLGTDGNIILKLIFMKWDGPWTGLIWLKIGTDGWLL